MKAMKQFVGLLVVLSTVNVVNAVVFDTVDKSKMRYGEPVFEAVVDGDKALAYKQEQLYLKQVHDRNGLCHKIVYSKQDGSPLTTDDFELIFGDEQARNGVALTISTPTVRFLRFDNAKVARVTLKEVTFFSKSYFEQIYGPVPTQRKVSEMMKAREDEVLAKAAVVAKKRELAQNQREQKKSKSVAITIKKKTRRVQAPVVRSVAPVKSEPDQHAANNGRSGVIYGLMLVGIISICGLVYRRYASGTSTVDQTEDYQPVLNDSLSPAPPSHKTHHSRFELKRQ